MTAYRDALVETDRPARWAKQLAAHLGRRLEVTETGSGPAVVLPHEDGPATCLLDTTDPDRLGLHVSAPSAEAADQLAGVVGSHLERFAEKEGLRVTWVNG